MTDMVVRVIDVDNNKELQDEWMSSYCNQFETEINKRLPRSGDVIFTSVHYIVINCVQNIDRGEIFLYVKAMLGFNPMKDQAYKFLPR